MASAARGGYSAAADEGSSSPSRWGHQRGHHNNHSNQKGFLAQHTTTGGDNSVAATLLAIGQTIDIANVTSAEVGSQLRELDSQAARLETCTAHVRGRKCVCVCGDRLRSDIVVVVLSVTRLETICWCTLKG